MSERKVSFHEAWGIAKDIDGYEKEAWSRAQRHHEDDRHEFSHWKEIVYARYSVLTDSLVEAVDHPAHYGGEDNPYEAIKVIEAWQLDFCLGNTVKYISRAGRKDPAKMIEDLEKARWYLDRRIQQLKSES